MRRRIFEFSSTCTRELTLPAGQGVDRYRGSRRVQRLSSRCRAEQGGTVEGGDAGVGLSMDTHFLPIRYLLLRPDRKANKGTRVRNTLMYGRDPTEGPPWEQGSHVTHIGGPYTMAH
jgi:hypothetical protein